MNKVLLTLIYLGFINFIHSQTNKENYSNLLSKKPEQLEIYFSNITNKEKRSKIAQFTLTEAKKSNNYNLLIKGYFTKLLDATHQPISIKYADSIITTANNNNDINMEAFGNLHKGIQLYYQSEHIEALSYYLKSQKYYKSINDEFYNLKIDHYIGILKNRSGNKHQALQIFRRNMAFFEKDSSLQLKYKSQYIKSLFALAESYNRNKLLDSAVIFNKLGIKKSFKIDKSMYPFFLLTYGAAMYYRNESHLGVDSLLKGGTFLEEKKNALATTYKIASLCYKKTGNDSLFVKYALKTDSIYQKHPKTVFDAKTVNLRLYEYYKKIGDQKNQIKSINKLLSIDSLIKKKHSKLEKEITKGYDIPKLIEEKELLINTLRNKNNATTTTSLIVTILSFITLTLLVYFIRKNLILKKRFKVILAETKNEKRKTVTPPETIIKSSELPKDVINKILKKLEVFEKSKQYLEKKQTLNSLAKDLDTNSSYLSKVINLEKGTNFSNYINGLKIDYAIDRLSNDSKFRSYTIKAISEELGFNNPNTFSSSFYKKTKLYPSYFIKQLNSKSKTQ